MALSFAQQLVNLGVPVAQAKEIASQVESGVYSKQRLVWSGMVPSLASIVATFPFDAVKAMSQGMTQAVANLIKGGVAPPQGYGYLFAKDQSSSYQQVFIKDNANNNQPILVRVRRQK